MVYGCAKLLGNEKENFEETQLTFSEHFGYPELDF
jgi:hypothetical protein